MSSAEGGGNGNGLSWPLARGAVIGGVSGLLLIASPLLGAVLIGLEAMWIAWMRKNGRDVAALKPLCIAAVTTLVAIVVVVVAQTRLLGGPATGEQPGPPRTHGVGGQHE